MSALTIQLSPSLAQQLNALVKNKGKTKAFYVNQALEEYLPMVKEKSFLMTASPRTPEESARIGETIEEGKKLRNKICSTTGGISLKEIKEMIEEGRA